METYNAIVLSTRTKFSRIILRRLFTMTVIRLECLIPRFECHTFSREKKTVSSSNDNTSLITINTTFARCINIIPL